MVSFISRFTTSEHVHVYDQRAEREQKSSFLLGVLRTIGINQYPEKGRLYIILLHVLTHLTIGPL